MPRFAKGHEAVPGMAAGQGSQPGGGCRGCNVNY